MADEGYATVYELDGEKLHTIGVSDPSNPEAYIDYQVRAEDVVEAKRDEINLAFAEHEEIKEILE